MGLCHIPKMFFIVQINIIKLQQVNWGVFISHICITDQFPVLCSELNDLISNTKHSMYPLTDI